MGDILCMPYVRQHLGAYLDWARNVPEAQPEVLLASISAAPDALSPRASASRTTSQLPTAPQPSPLTHTASTAAGSSNSSINAQRGQAAGSSTQSLGQDACKGSAGSSAISASALGASCRPAVPEQLGPREAATRDASIGSPAEVGSAQSVASAPKVSPGAQVVPAAQRAERQQEPSIVSQTVSKPNPFYAAAASLAALPDMPAGPQLGAPASLAAPTLMLNKHKALLGGAGCSYSLDCWTSASGNDPSSELIMAFRSSFDSAGPRRASSASCSSTANTPKSPLGQYMHSWQQGAHEKAADQQQQQQQPLPPTAAVQTKGVNTAGGPTAGGESNRSTDEHLSGGLISVAVPWLTNILAGLESGAASQRTSADNWLSSIVQSLEQLQQEGPPAWASQQQTCKASSPSTNPLAPSGFKAWDPHMASIDRDSLAAGGLGGRTTTSSASHSSQLPTSLQGWLSGDNSLMQQLQQLQKRASRISRTSFPGSNPSPLGSSGNSAKPMTASNGMPARMACYSPAPQDEAPAAAFVPSSDAAAPGAMQQPTSPGEKASSVHHVSVLAAADSCGPPASQACMWQDDDLPLAVMVKQCLSGNSFLYTTNGSADPVVDGDRAAAVGRFDSGTHSSSNLHSGSCLASTGRTDSAAGSGEWAGQEDTKLAAEQHVAMMRFNAFRATLGIKPGKSLHCPVVRCVN